jgi:UDP-2,3-diacylglucosamine pyrophosphatase LpxH
VRALVISDTHFGAWTGEDILREPETLALLAPYLDVDEVILLGDMFDFLFSSMQDAFDAAGPLLDLLRDKLQGKRFVFLAGNHDHFLVRRETDELIELELATGESPDELRGEVRRIDFFRRFLERRLDGVEVDIRYPTYAFSGVLCTHGHYLDFHARRSGGAPGRLLARTLWSIAVGGAEHMPSIDDYESTITMLTGLLFMIAQLPNGTQAQQRAFAAFQAISRAIRVGAAPVRTVEHASDVVASLVGSHTRAARRISSVTSAADIADYHGAMAQEAERRQQTGAPAGGEVANLAFARVVRASDPSGPALDAFEKVVANLGWAHDTDKIVFAHTHQPLDGVTTRGGHIRYWNTGSWIYEPALSSHEAYIGYLTNAWPGTAVLIDSDEPDPRLLKIREHLNPLYRDRTNDNREGTKAGI